MWEDFVVDIYKGGVQILFYHLHSVKLLKTARLVLVFAKIGRGLLQLFLVELDSKKLDQIMLSDVGGRLFSIFPYYFNDRDGMETFR